MFQRVAAMQARLLQPAVMQQQLLPAATQLASSGQLSGTAALHCLANMAQLLTGCSQQQQQQQRSVTAPSPHLEDSTTAVAYCRAAVQLLSAGTQLKQSNGSSSNSRQQQRNLASGSAGKDRQQARQQQGQCSSSSGSNVAAEAASILQDGCWMLGSQQHLLQLLRVLNSSSQEVMVLWAGYCVHLLQDAARISTAAAARPTDAATDSSQSAAGSGQLSTAVLNVVAFAPGVLPGVWRWLAVTAGLPLEAPLQASRGLDIAAVAGGPDGLQKPVGLVMGLFCRCAALQSDKACSCCQVLSWQDRCNAVGRFRQRSAQDPTAPPIHAAIQLQMVPAIERQALSHSNIWCNEELTTVLLLLLLAGCRGLAQLLQVLDDTDLHTRQEPFTLGASRAIASTLNSLVFHTAFPEQQQRGQQQQLQGLSTPLLPATAAHGLVRPGDDGSTCTGLWRMP
jgi:hypothetical protein